MVASMRNYIIYAIIGPTTTALTRSLDGLHTDAGQNFIQKSELTAEDTKQIAMKSLPELRDAKRTPIRSCRVMSLIVQLGNHV